MGIRWEDDIDLDDSLELAETDHLYTSPPPFSARIGNGDAGSTEDTRSAISIPGTRLGCTVLPTMMAMALMGGSMKVLKEERRGCSALVLTES